MNTVFGKEVLKISWVFYLRILCFFQAEDLDVNASIHGNWTVENAKSKLHQFLQVNKINTDYKYTTVGPDHTK